LPDRIDGKSLIDIGAFNGMHSFEAERRGARTVLATDVWESDDTDGRTWSQISGKEGFEMARACLDSDVEAKSANVLTLSPGTVGTFDVSLCLGVLYFLDDIPAAVRNLVDVTEELVVVEALTRSPRPFRSVAEPGTDEDEPPTPRDFETMLRTAGCSRVESFPL